MWFELEVDAVVRALVAYNDFDSAIYDSEDGVYLFCHRPHELRLFKHACSVEIAFSIDTDKSEIKEIIQCGTITDWLLYLTDSELIEDRTPPEDE